MTGNGNEKPISDVESRLAKVADALRNKDLGLDDKTCKIYEEIFIYPGLIKLEKGCIVYNKSLPPLETCDMLSQYIPDAPDIYELPDEEDRRVQKTIYQVGVIYQSLPYTQDYIVAMIDNGLDWFEIKQKLTELGTDIQLLLSATSRKLSINQTTKKQWGKYHLLSGEVIKLESVASLRREINVRRANWESSDEFFTASKVVKAQKDAGFEKELAEVTDTLWKILHYGVDCLSGEDRKDLNFAIYGLSKKERLPYVEDRIINLRISELKKYRIEGDDYKILKPKS